MAAVADSGELNLTGALPSPCLVPKQSPWYCPTGSCCALPSPCLEQSSAAMEQAFETVKAQGCNELQPNVLSDNPAVGFYHSLSLEALVRQRIP